MKNEKLVLKTDEARAIYMCNFVAIGLVENDCKYLSILGDYWECKNESIVSINPGLKWNWVLTIDLDCSCNFFNPEKNQNVRDNFMKLSSLVTQIVIYNHQTAGDPNKDIIEISPIKNISISDFFRLKECDIIGPYKLHY